MRKVLMVLMALALVAALPTGALAQGQVLGLGVKSKFIPLPPDTAEIASEELKKLDGFIYISVREYRYCRPDGTTVIEREYTICLGIFCGNIRR